MNTTTITIRTATPADAPALLAIYAPYITDTAVSLNMMSRLLKNSRTASGGL